MTPQRVRIAASLTHERPPAVRSTREGALADGTTHEGVPADGTTHEGVPAGGTTHEGVPAGGPPDLPRHPTLSHARRGRFGTPPETPP